MSKRTLSNTEIASFCSQCALLFKSGITPVESMYIMLEDTKDSAGIAIIQGILDECEKGERFANAIETSGRFPDYVVKMIRLGEESGNLDVCMQSLADYYEREEEIAQSIKSAITYPVIMVAMMIVIMIVLVSKVLPIFNQVFEQLGTEMTGLSKSLLVFGQVINKYIIVVIAVLVILAALYVAATKSEKGKKAAKRFFNKFPLTRGFYTKVAAGRFASGMALALSSGLDTVSSLEMVAEIIEHPETVKKINDCRDHITEGYDFAESVAGAGIFTTIYNRMISVGFKSGASDSVMKQISVSYDKEINKKLVSIIAIIEPTLVIVLSVIVGLILLSVILPLMGIMSSIG
ncbi:MAG: type II secretion system F family protein [Eubacterium sp.]|nr:type II secretion system F family protein [Eubacterium sp.]